MLKLPRSPFTRLLIPSVLMVAQRAGAATPISEPEARPLALRVTLSPEWAYRSFRDNEPNSTPKQYTAAGVPAASVRFELYPLALVSAVPDALKNIGLTANYFRAFGVESRDPDNPDRPPVETRWYEFGFGARYRAMGGGDAPLAVGFTAGVQRRVFDFGTNPPDVPVAIGRYTLLPLGADTRYSWREFSILADVRFLLPVTISPPDDRSPSGARYGLHAAVAAALRLSVLFEVELRATYAMIGYSLPNAIRSASANTSILDASLVFGAGASFLY